MKPYARGTGDVTVSSRRSEANCKPKPFHSQFAAGVHKARHHHLSERPLSHTIYHSISTTVQLVYIPTVA